MLLIIGALELRINNLPNCKELAIKVDMIIALYSQSQSVFGEVVDSPQIQTGENQHSPSAEPPLPLNHRSPSAVHSSGDIPGLI